MRTFVNLFVLQGLLLVGLAIPLIRRKVRPNPWYGFRTPKTLRNAAVWYPANAYCGRLMRVVGLLWMAAALLLARIPGITTDSYTLGVTAVILASLLWMVIRCFQYLKRL